MPRRHYLDVPYEERDEAKILGAQWDGRERRWFVPPTFDTRLFARWSAVSITEFPGEDRTFPADAPRLFVDLIPSTSWYQNARSVFGKKEWDAIRRFVHTRTDGRCEACGTAETSLDAHERWAYDEETAIQSLRRILALCKPCHRATHYGRTMLYGDEDEALSQLRGVNGWTDRETTAHVAEAYRLHARRSKITWTVDVSILGRAGIAPKKETAP